MNNDNIQTDPFKRITVMMSHTNSCIFSYSKKQNKCLLQNVKDIALKF